MSTGKQRQGKAQASGCWIRAEKRLAIYLRDNFCCVYCGQDLKKETPQNVTLDHLTPRSQGGDNRALNLVTACRACNCSRGAREWTEYATGGAVARIFLLTALPLNSALAKSIIAGDCSLDEVR